MSKGSSDACLHHVASMQMVIFRALMEQALSASNDESLLCDHFVFLKRFALLNDAAGKHLAKDNFPSELIQIAGKFVLST